MRQVQSQDMQYTRRVIDSLCSPLLDGRGYVNRGDYKAAVFIRSEFEKIGLQPIGKSYFQNFKFPVNTFPGKMVLKINDKTLFPGIDFLVDAASSKKKGTFRIMNISSANFRGSLDSLKRKFLLIDKTSVFSKDEHAAMDLWITDPHGAAGVLAVEEKKLTWNISRKQYKHPVIRVLKTSLPESPQMITLKVESRLRRKYETQNILGMIHGTVHPDSFIVFTAHYDHLGRMGKSTWFPGANDNASGVSMLLNMAKHYRQNPPRCSMLFIAFAGEEAGLMGSEFFIKHPLIPLKSIRFLINMDLVGTGDDGLMVVNGEILKEQFSLMEQINNRMQLVKSLQKRGKARNSDHFWFSENGVPCFFVYTLGGIAAYHDINDRPQTLPLTDYSDVFKLLTGFADALQ